ncbi:MAG: hypothetical protein FJ303_06065 [Planctomycetes bacterium]|nr:hypothetical protein [Planctomycetota bacterium]
MRNWILACVAAVAISFLPDAASAQEQLAAPKTTVVQSSTMTRMAPRGGLLARLRDRRGMMRVMPAASTTSSTVQPATATTPATTTTAQPRMGLLARLRARLAR